MNMNPTQDISSFLRAISQAPRIEILLAIGTSEACVCHLEAAIGQRQAYISQQLMILREAGIVTSRREGRNIYYRLKDPTVLDLIQQAGRISGYEADELPVAGPMNILDECPCPQCDIESTKDSLQNTSKDAIYSEKQP
jgi:DNA-binding transcriptional ArsR family regulator